jgi:hypothetical protein
MPPHQGRWYRVNRFVAFRSMRVRGLRRSLPKTLRIGRIVGRLNAIEGGYPRWTTASGPGCAVIEADNDALATWLDRDLSGWG